MPDTFPPPPPAPTTEAPQTPSSSVAQPTRAAPLEPEASKATVKALMSGQPRMDMEPPSVRAGQRVVLPAFTVSDTAIQAPMAGTERLIMAAPLPMLKMRPGSAALSACALSGEKVQEAPLRKVVMELMTGEREPACAAAKAALLAVVLSCASAAVKSGVARLFVFVPLSTIVSALLAVTAPEQEQAGQTQRPFMPVSCTFQ